MKNFFIIIFITFSSTSFAYPTCQGIPNTIYAGAHGPSPSEANYWVTFEGSSLRYRLGLPSDDMAKSRFSLAQTALVAGKQFILKFYTLTTCEEASSSGSLPSSTNIKK